MIYHKAINALRQHYRVKQVVHGVAHITGGGFGENIDRILPGHVTATIRRGSWTVPPIFGWLQQRGEVEDTEMHRVFNMGIGMCLIVSEYYSDAIVARVRQTGTAATVIGEIVKGDGTVVMEA